MDGSQTSLEQSREATLRKVAWRIVPLLMLCYFAAYLDRVNLSFAALSMNHDLGISATSFGLGAGMFFLGYVIFELPSNLALRRFGARVWFTRIMVSWGIVSLLFAFAWNGTSVVVLRCLLGAAEAGFFPGVIYFLSGWFPAARRARIIAAFAVAIPASTALGAPISSFILGLDGAMGFHGWQWLFLFEATPSLIMAVLLFRFLPSSPANAGWLEPAERQWLSDAVEVDRPADHDRNAVRAALLDVRIWLLGFAYCGIVASNYGIAFWLPQIVAGFNVSRMSVGLLSAVPYVVGAIGMIWWSRRSDRLRERCWHVIIPSVVAAVGILVSAASDDLTIKMVALSCAGFGAFANLPVFWALPSTFLSEKQAAAGIAVISSIGNIAGFAAPYVMGVSKDATNGFGTGLVVLAVFVLVAISVIWPLSRRASWDPVEARL